MGEFALRSGRHSLADYASMECLGGVDWSADGILGDHPTEIHDVQRAELVGGSEVGANTGEVNRRNREFLSPTLRLEIGHRGTGRLRLEIDEDPTTMSPGICTAGRRDRPRRCPRLVSRNRGHDADHAESLWHPEDPADSTIHRVVSRGRRSRLNGAEEPRPGGQAAVDAGAPRS